jgi:selenocysteine-specific elongation factor
VHHGTTETPARVVRVGERFAQLRLASPVVAARNDRVVLRDRTTLGGGRILDPAPPRAPDEARFELLATNDPVSIVQALVHEPVRSRDLAARALLAPEQLEEGLAAVGHSGEWYYAPEWLEQIERETRTRLLLRAEATPLDPGLSTAELLQGAPWTEAVIPLLDLERRNGKVYLAGSAGGLGEREEQAAELESRVAEGGFTPTAVDDAELARFLEEAGRLVRIGDGLAIGPRAYEEAKRALVDECGREGRITLARFRDLLGISRKPAQLLLERFDSDGVTRRIGDERVLRRGATGRGDSGS